MTTQYIKNRFHNQFKDEKNIVIDKYFIKNKKVIETWSEKEYEDYLISALRYTLKHVVENNEYYSNKINKAIKNIDEFNLKKFSEIEFLNKEEMMENTDLILSSEDISEIFVSTGTTGKGDIYVKHTWEDLYLTDLSIEMPILFPIRKEDIVAIALPYEMSSAGLSFHRVIQNGVQCKFISVGKGGAYSEPVKTLKAMKSVKVNVIITSPSYAVYLYEKCVENGIDGINIDTIWLTGEGCSNEYRKKIERMWNCKALFYYGSLECGPIGIECQEKDGYHICSGHNYIEIVDPISGNALSEGEIGEIVITTLLKKGSPFIRYRTGDLGYIDSPSCSCGINLKKLYLRGRIGEQIKIHDNEYSPFYLENELMKIDLVGNHYMFVKFEDFFIILVHLNECVIDKKYNYEKYKEVISSKFEYLTGVENKVFIVDKFRNDGKKVKRLVKVDDIYSENKIKEILDIVLN